MCLFVCVPIMCVILLGYVLALFVLCSVRLVLLLLLVADFVFSLCLSFSDCV